MKTECAWFHKCHEPTVAEVEHPTMGWVAICQRHLDWLRDEPSPTKMVPPMVARHAAKIQGIMARLDLNDD